MVPNRQSNAVIWSYLAPFYCCNFFLGILEKEQEQLVVYGSIDFGKTVVQNEKYKELLAKTAKLLKIRPHT